MTWMLLPDDMSEAELADAAEQQREDAHPYGPLNDDPYTDRSWRILPPGQTLAAPAELRVRRIRIARHVRDAVARDAASRQSHSEAES